MFIKSSVNLNSAVILVFKTFIVESSADNFWEIVILLLLMIDFSRDSFTSTFVSRLPIDEFVAFKFKDMPRTRFLIAVSFKEIMILSV